MINLLTLEQRPTAVANPPSVEHSLPRDELIEARTAAAMLGVKMQTLYAYVSRGLVRAVPSNDKRGNLYYLEDIESVRLKGRVSSASGEAVERLMRWGGGAVLQTSITAMGPQGPRYRGKLATDLATMQRPFEDVVELLWGGVLPEHSLPWQPLQVAPSCQALMNSLGPMAPQNNSRRLLALCAELHAASLKGRPEQVLGASVLAGRQLIQVLAGAFGLLKPEPQVGWRDSADTVAASVALSLDCAASDAELAAIDACLVLGADHELAPSTFAARIAASAGADIYSCTTTALGAFEGLLTGLGCDQAESLLHRVASPRAYVVALQDLLGRRQPLPGYNHPMYPAGDPRALHLIERARRLTPRSARGTLVLDAIELACGELGIHPSQPIGVVALCEVLDLPPRTPGALLALGRTAGWVAHTLEQRLAGFLVRPRARYVGTPA